MEQSHNAEVATLGGGSFWGLDAVFRRVHGVRSVVAGYAGGTAAEPSAGTVRAGDSGHAEVVQVTFDPAVLSYRELLELFFGAHDPTTINRQGADVGPQYRSVIYAHSPEQQRTAEVLIAELERSGEFGDAIVTQVEPAPAFHPAADDQQDYVARHPAADYAQAVAAPRLEALRVRFADRLAAR